MKLHLISVCLELLASHIALALLLEHILSSISFTTLVYCQWCTNQPEFADIQCAQPRPWQAWADLFHAVQQRRQIVMHTRTVTRCVISSSLRVKTDILKKLTKTKSPELNLSRAQSEPQGSSVTMSLSTHWIKAVRRKIIATSEKEKKGQCFLVTS